MLPTKEKGRMGVNCRSCVWHILKKSLKEDNELYLFSDKKAEDGDCSIMNRGLTFPWFNLLTKFRYPYIWCLSQ